MLRVDPEVHQVLAVLAGLLGISVSRCASLLLMQQLINEGLLKDNDYGPEVRRGLSRELNIIEPQPDAARVKNVLHGQSTKDKPTRRAKKS